jgi:hypothetical protein
LFGRSEVFWDKNTSYGTYLNLLNAPTLVQIKFGRGSACGDNMVDAILNGQDGHKMYKDAIVFKHLKKHQMTFGCA